MLGITSLSLERQRQSMIRGKTDSDKLVPVQYITSTFFSSFLLSFSGGLRDLLILGCCETCLFLIWVGWLPCADLRAQPLHS
jgi:hypothetical protein